jgi:hypothetical protein
VWFYADESKYDRVADALYRTSDRGDFVGADSEFYGVGENRPTYDIRKESPAGGRTRVHMWSVAIKRYPHVLHPRGYHVTDTAVLLGGALEHPRLRQWLESDCPKVYHNRDVDDHAQFGHGIVLGGAVDSLARARWVWPERARGSGFSLDSLGLDLLGIGKAASFQEVFSEEVDEVIKVKEVETKFCLCGVWRCRARKFHSKLILREQFPVIRRVVRRIPMETVGPDHPRFKMACEYAARDAWVGAAIEDRIRREMEREVPYPYGRITQVA